MPEFLAVLANLYLCDAILDIRHPTMQEVTTCAESTNAVHTYFAPSFDLAPEGTPARAAQMAAAVLAFEAWEAGNADLVTDMQAAAWLSARQTGQSIMW